MAGMFDFFSEKARLTMPGATDPTSLERERERKRRLTPTFLRPVAPLGQVFQDPGTSSGASDVAETRPRLAAPPPPPAAGPQMSETERQLQAARLRTAGYRDITGPAVYDEQGKQISGKPVNNDRGVGGRLKDILRQAVISAGEAYNNGSGDPGQRLMAAIGGGIAGGVGGGLKPTLDEERQRLHDIARSTGDENRLLGIMEQDAGMEYRRAQTADVASQPILKQREINARNAATAADGIKAQQQLIFNTWKELPEGADLTDPQYSDIALQAQQYNVALPRKKEGNKEYFGSWSPDGKYAILDKNTGQERLGFGGASFAAETKASPSDFSDDRFPFLMTERDARLRAAEQVAPEYESIAVNEQTANDLINYENTAGEFPYRNPDGTLNKNKFLQDAALDLAPVQYGSLYRSQARSISNKLSRKERELWDQQRGVRAEVEKFKTAVKGRPVSVANEAADIFNEIMQDTNVQRRRKALKKFWEKLS
jgi:hypothetical protein